MAYFSNGAEGMDYEEHYCSKCVHFKGEEGLCPVMDAHWHFAYDLCNKMEDPGKVILDLLIPMNEKHYPAKCSMFYEAKP